MKKNTDEHVKDPSGANENDTMKKPEGADAGAQTQQAAEAAVGEVPGGTTESGTDEAEKSAAAGVDPDSRLKELEKQNADLQDQYLRKAADFDNYRKRMIREKQEAIDYANTGLLLDLVQVLDDFDRAINAGGSTGEQDGGTAFSNGVSMIRKQLGSLLETKYGLEYFPSKDTGFDPNIHEAIGTVPDPSVKEPTVAEEYLKGYKLKGRVIRAAKVMVKMPQESAAE